MNRAKSSNELLIAAAKSYGLDNRQKLSGTMGLRVFNKKEMRDLRDDYLEENGHNLLGIGELGSSDSEKSIEVTSPGVYKWKKRVNR